VALGTADGVIEQGGQTIRVAPDPEALAAVAHASGGRAFAAEDAGALDEVYERLGSQIGTREERREITAGFAAAGLLLLGAGVATSLRWRGRFP
jgi:Ca-activated chloride channel family protein